MACEDSLSSLMRLDFEPHLAYSAALDERLCRGDNSEGTAMIDKWLRDRRVHQTARIVVLACFSFVLGGTLEHFRPINFIFCAALVAFFLFLLIRDAWNRGA